MKGNWIIQSFVMLFGFGLFSCIENDPNKDESGQDQLKSLEIDRELSPENQRYSDTFYVPIYSDIYIDEQHPKNLLSATLSIRNVSDTDTLFVSKIDYYNTAGELVRHFIDQTIALPAMASVNYVVEREDETGGSGANFIVEVSASNNIAAPRIQAVMIGEYSNKGFSFSVDGSSVKRLE